MAEETTQHKKVEPPTDPTTLVLSNGTATDHEKTSSTSIEARPQASYADRIGRRKVDKDGTVTWISQRELDEQQRQSDPAVSSSKFSFYLDDSDTRSKIKITTPGLLNAVEKTIPRSLFEWTPGSALFPEPYGPLFQYSDDIRRELQSQPDLDSKVLDDFEVLVSFLQSHTGYVTWKTLGQENQAAVTFENLWALFRDGDLLLLKDQLEESRLFKFTRLEEEFGEVGNLKSYCTGIRVHFWHIFWSSGDNAFCRRSGFINIPRFAGMRKAVDLPVYPWRYESESTRTALLKTLVDRGKRWSDLVSNPPSCFEYAGHAVLEGDEMSDNTTPIHIRGRVIVDQKGTIGRVFADFEQGRGTRGMEFNLGDSWSASRFFRKVDPADLQLCPSQLRAYHVPTSKYYFINVKGLEPVLWEANAIKKLVLDKDKKDLLKSIVRNTDGWDTRSGDIIHNKGRGLTIVLHGPPGVGKTLTAECMAEYACKPLIHLSVGDLVAFDDSIEERLTAAFETAARLGAILLLDEADVVLEARSFEDVRRNGIVSVFLRQLEYYNGILFMTTNRINTMDPAFQSRIQIALHYPELTPEKRQEIWLSLLSSHLIDCTDDDRAIIQDHVAQLAEYRLNGRQIRNTLRLSGLAADQDLLSGRKVKLRHIEKALEETLAFQGYFEEGKKDRTNRIRTWKPFVPAQSRDYQ